MENRKIVAKKMPGENRANYKPNFEASMKDTTIKINGFSSMNHTFDVYLATEYGIEQAILIHHFQHWIMVNKRMGKNFKEGRTWTYQTLKWILAHFPYWKNELKIFRIIESLVSKNVLIKGNFSQNSHNRTCWYAFANEEKFISQVEFDPALFEEEKTEETSSGEKCIFQKRKMDISKMKNGNSENEKCNKEINTKDRCLRKENTYAPPEGDASTCHTAKQKPEKTERSPNVETTDQEHAKLVDKYGPAVVEQCYQELSLWKESASRAQVKRHTSDYLRITKWVALSVIDQEQKEKKLMSPGSSTSKGSQIEKNRDHALNRLSGFDPSIARCLEHYVEIRIQGKAHQLFYDAHGFEEQLRNALDKACPYPQKPTKGSS